MVEDKVGIKEYLGIKINYSNEKNLDKFSRLNPKAYMVLLD